MNSGDRAEKVKTLAMIGFVAAVIATGCGGLTIGPRIKTEYVFLEDFRHGKAVVLNRRLVATIKAEGVDPVRQNIAGFWVVHPDHMQDLLDELKELRAKYLKKEPK